MTQTLPILYSFRRCPYAIRARMALVYSGITVELREITLKNKPLEMLAISPKGTTPVLQLSDGQVIDESLDIMTWALEQSDPEGWLPDAKNQVVSDEWIALTQRDFKQHLDHYKYPERAPEKSQLAHRELAEKFLLKLEETLAQQNYLITDTITIADIAIFPFVRQFAKVDSEWFEQSPYRLTRAWLNQFLANPYFEVTMQKYPVWQVGNTLCQFP